MHLLFVAKMFCNFMLMIEINHNLCLFLKNLELFLRMFTLSYSSQGAKKTKIQINSLFTVKERSI